MAQNNSNINTFKNLMIPIYANLEMFSYVKGPELWNISTATSLCEVSTRRIQMSNTNLSLPRQIIELQASNTYDGMEISPALSSRHWTKRRESERTS
jgi:hypothetical protein